MFSWQKFSERIHPPLHVLNFGLICLAGIRKTLTPKEEETPPKVQKTNKYTPFWSAGAGGKKGEEKLESQDRVVLSQAQSPPLIYSGAGDVTYANQADQMTRCYIFNFLRAHGEESSGGRTLVGEGDIFRRRNNCVKNLVCQGLKNGLLGD